MWAEQAVMAAVPAAAYHVDKAASEAGHPAAGPAGLACLVRSCWQLLLSSE